ncbi:hypothetical protein EBZ80_24670 [bacterium]|nr:hypothetical protein [bacterium]
MLTGPEATVIGSEFFLSLYPILIKLVRTTLPTQLLVRFGTFAAGAAAPASAADLVAVAGSWAAIQRTLLVGLIAAVHTWASYAAFASLSTGVSMSLFYTYPLWNLVGAKVIYGESVGSSIPYLLSGILGTYLVSTKGLGDPIGGVTRAVASPAAGVALALLAALTESAMYFVVKDRASTTPWASMLELYGGAAVWLLAAAPLLGLSFAWNWSAIGLMTAFNVLVGFVGYALRYYAVPLVSTEVFGLLSFVGVLSAFLFGFIFAGERPGMWSIVGAALIVWAVANVETIKKAVNK